MASAFETVTLKDGRVLVILHPACGISKEHILVLLVELGVDADLVTFLQPQETVDFDLDAVPVVIPLDQASCDAPELEELVRGSARPLHERCGATSSPQPRRYAHRPSRSWAGQVLAYNRGHPNLSPRP